MKNKNLFEIGLQPLVWAFLIRWRHELALISFLSTSLSLIALECLVSLSPVFVDSTSRAFLFQKFPDANLYFAFSMEKKHWQQSVRKNKRCSLADWEGSQIKNLEDGRSRTRCQRLHAGHRRRWGKSGHLFYI